VAFSADAEQSCLYVADLTNFTTYEINRKTLQAIDRFGSGGKGLGQFHWPHKLSVDSEGNVYAGEVDGNWECTEVPALWCDRVQRDRSR
jgi:hypothetical protein